MKPNKIILMALFAVFLSAITIAIIYGMQQFGQKQDYQPIITGILQNNQAAIKTFEHSALFTQKQILLENSGIKKALIHNYIQQVLDPISAISNIYENSIENEIFQEQQVYQALITHYFHQIEIEIEGDNFVQAFSLLDKFKTKYPKSKVLHKKYDELKNRKKERLAFLIQDYMRCLEKTQAPLLERTHCMVEARQKIEHVGIDHYLPTDPNLPTLYADEIKQALTEKNYVRAEKMLLDWQNLIVMPSKQRDRLEKRLNLHQEVKSIIADLTALNQENIVKRLTQLIIAPLLQREILEMPIVQKNLLRYHLNEALALMTIKNVPVDPMSEIRIEEILTTARETRSPAYIAWSTPQPEQNTQEIEHLLEECQRHYDANRLTTGYPGTALACYQEVLEKNPANRDAVKGLKTLETRYADWAKTALHLNKLDKMKNYIAGLKRVNPYSPTIAQLNQQLLAATIGEAEIQYIPQTCDDCNCSSLLTQLSIGLKPLTTVETQFFQKDCR